MPDDRDVAGTDVPATCSACNLPLAGRRYLKLINSDGELEGVLCPRCAPHLRRRLLTLEGLTYHVDKDIPETALPDVAHCIRSTIAHSAFLRHSFADIYDVRNQIIHIRVNGDEYEWSILREELHRVG